MPLEGRTTCLMRRGGRGKRVVTTRYRHGVRWEGSFNDALAHSRHGTGCVRRRCAKTALRKRKERRHDPDHVDETENREVTRRLGAGVQVYDRNPDGTFGFREPQADLYVL